MDKAVIRKHSKYLADRNTSYWRSRPFADRLKAGYEISMRAFGVDPANPPRMAREQVVRPRKR